MYLYKLFGHIISSDVELPVERYEKATGESLENCCDTYLCVWGAAGFLGEIRGQIEKCISPKVYKVYGGYYFDEPEYCAFVSDTAQMIYVNFYNHATSDQYLEFLTKTVKPLLLRLR